MPDPSRRRFLGSAALALTANRAFAAAKIHSLEAIGVQLYTVRDLLKTDPAATLKELDAIGYREAEVIWGGIDSVWPALEKTRLKPISIHLDNSLFKKEKASDLSAAIADCKRRGFSYAVCPYVPPNERGGLPTFHALAETLNRAGEECRKAGLMLCYHNHAFEFEPMEGTTGFEVLMKETDKALVGLEMDVFWVSVGGHDPAEMLKKYAGRVPLIHMKNKAEAIPTQYNERVPRSLFKEAGAGILDMKAILRVAADSGVKHYFVEQDQTPGNPVDSLRQSFEYLKPLKF